MGDLNPLLDWSLKKKKKKEEEEKKKWMLLKFYSFVSESHVC